MFVSSVANEVAAEDAAVAALLASVTDAPCETEVVDPEEVVTVLWVRLTLVPVELVSTIGVVVVVVLVPDEVPEEVPPPVPVGVAFTVGVGPGPVGADEVVTAVLTPAFRFDVLSTTVFVRGGGSEVELPPVEPDPPAEPVPPVEPAPPVEPVPPDVPVPPPVPCWESP